MIASVLKVIFPLAIDAIEAALRHRRRAIRLQVPIQFGVHFGQIERDINGELAGAAAVASDISRFAVAGEVLAITGLEVAAEVSRDLDRARVVAADPVEQVVDVVVVYKHQKYI